MSGLVEERKGFADGVADGGPADTQQAGQYVHRAQVPLVEDGEQDAFPVADLLMEDAAAGTGLAGAAATLIAEAFGLGGLLRCELPGEVMQLAPGEPGQRRVGQLLDDRGPCGPQIAVCEGQQGIAGCEPDRGDSGVMAVKASWLWVRTLLHSVYDQPDAASVHAQYDRLIDAVTEKLPAVGAHLDTARADVLAFTAFPKELWRQIWSNNPQVIWSPRGGVLHVDHEGLRSRDLRCGRGYLPLSITRISGGNHACSAGAVARLVA